MQNISSHSINHYEKSLIYLLEKNDVLIVVGDADTGKSTSIPQILYSTGCYDTDIQEETTSTSRLSHKQICVTVPRRVAAVQLAQSVARELGCTIGQTVGYSIRFKDVTSDITSIKYTTEGILIREMISDPLLKGYSVIILDEVHERSIECDILLGLLKCLLDRRHDLKLILCSSTKDIKDLRNFFSKDNNKRIDVLIVDGKRFPLKIYHRLEVVADYVETTVKTIIDIHESNRLASGKILAFLTGQDEVQFVCDKLRDYAEQTSNRLELLELNVLPLYATLKREEVDRVFEVDGTNVRSCIITTNIGETSLTIDGIAFIVDCGFTKIKQFDHRTGMDHLIRIPISKSSARQRAERARRTREGAVYRLYRQCDYDNLLENTVPEIKRTSMAEPIMLLMSLGFQDVESLPLVSPMQKQNMISGLELLHTLDILDSNCQLTLDGQMICRLNIDPKLARSLIQSAESRFNCSVEVSRIIAMLQPKDIFCKPNQTSYANSSREQLEKICVQEGDLLSYLNIINAFIASNQSKKWADRRNLNYQALLNACEIAAKLETQIKKLKLKWSSSNRSANIQKSLLSGLFTNAAYLHPNGDYKTINGDHTVFIHPTSVFATMLERPEYLVFVEIMNTTKPYMRHLMAIERDWLLKLDPPYYFFATELESRRSNRVVDVIQID